MSGREHDARERFERALERARARHVELPHAEPGAATPPPAPDLAAIRARIDRPAPPARRWSRVAIAAAGALAAGVAIAFALRALRPNEPRAQPIPAGPSEPIATPTPPPAASIAEPVANALREVSARAWSEAADPLAARADALDDALAAQRAAGWPIARWVERALSDAALDAPARTLALDYLALRGDRRLAAGLPPGHRLLAAALDAAALRALFADAASTELALAELERAGCARSTQAVRRVLETLPESKLDATARDALLARLARCGEPGATALLELSLSSSVRHDALRAALRTAPEAALVVARLARSPRAAAVEPALLLGCASDLRVDAAAALAERSAADPLLEQPALACLAALATPEALVALLRIDAHGAEVDVAPYLVRALRSDPDLGRRALAAAALPREHVRNLLALCDRAGDGSAAPCALALAADARLDANERVRAVELAIELGDATLAAPLRALYDAPAQPPRLRASCLVGAARLAGAPAALAWLDALPPSRRERIANWLNAERALAQPITTVSRIERELAAPPTSVSL
ncbi:MAG: hypothetical protein EPO68_03805 [Planctomycetota bacterium]|nr:MAG: hypothetical protein EPO68_03805 [Planctomycetota bacterium]